MVQPQIVEYIKTELAKGIDREQIKNALRANSWVEEDISDSFNSLSQETPVPSPTEQPSQSTSTSLPSASALLSQAWSLYRSRLWTLVGISIIPILVGACFVLLVSGGSIALSILSTHSVGTRISTLLALILSSHPIGTGIGTVVALFVLALLGIVVVFIFTAWCQVALLYAVANSNQNLGIKAAYRISWHKIMSFWWVVFLVGFICMGGYVLIIVPGVILSIWFSLSLTILVVEDIKGMNALMKSKEYARGHWGELFWRFLVLAIIAIIITFLPSFILGYLRFSLVYSIIRLLINIFLTPLAIAYTFVVYRNIRDIKGDVVIPAGGGKKLGFALLGVLGLLGTITLPALIAYRVVNALHSTRNNTQVLYSPNQNGLDELRSAIATYYFENHKYPTTLNDLNPSYTKGLDLSKYQYEVFHNGRYSLTYTSF